MQQRFGPEHRIRHRPEFLEIYEHGRKLHGRLVVLFARCRATPDSPAPQPWRLGLAATRKLGKANVRNLLRRRTREFFRRHGALPEGWDFVVNFKPASISASYADLAAELTRLIEKAAPQASRIAKPGSV